MRWFHRLQKGCPNKKKKIREYRKEKPPSILSQLPSLTILQNWFVIFFQLNLRRLLIWILFIFLLSSAFCYLASFGPRLKLWLTTWTMVKVFKLNKIISMNKRLKHYQKPKTPNIWLKNSSIDWCNSIKKR